ncbi:hypothetical protein CHUAL_011553 [Chamberlinius hualienensis]
MTEKSTTYLFHYTNPTGRRKIVKDKMIRATPVDSQFSWYGEGVYLTSLSPSEGRQKILYNNYHKKSTKDKKLLAKTSVYFKFNIKHLIGVVKCNDRFGRDIYLYPHTINLTVIEYSTGESDNYRKEICQIKVPKSLKITNDMTELLYLPVQTPTEVKTFQLNVPRLSKKYPCSCTIL